MRNLIFQLQTLAKQKSILAFLGLLATAALFQNCTGGFRSTEGFELPQNVSLTLDSNVAPAVIPYYQINATELVPQQFKVQADEELNYSDLPPGALYEIATKTLLWIPRKGQAGNYVTKVWVKSGRQVAQLNISVAPAQQDFVAKGPADGAADGDVGYVFVHGKGGVDRCADHADLLAYWGGTQNIITRRPELSTLTCYDGRKKVEEVAVSVANQILAANCGRFIKCVIVTHSMGGLVVEYIMNHTRAARITDQEPQHYANAALFQKVKEKTLGVISVASAAGGSKVAEALQDPDGFAFPITVVGVISNWIGSNDGSTMSTGVERATHILSPINEDPEVPFYMVPGYSVQTAYESDSLTGRLLDGIFTTLPITVYQSDSSLAKLDAIVQFDSRGDGLVDFRGACAVNSTNARDGYGYRAPLDQHLKYCYQAPKKLNHQVWFISNLNHFLISTDWANCRNDKNPCMILEPNPGINSFSENASLRGQSAMAVMRAKLDSQRQDIVVHNVAVGSKN